MASIVETIVGDRRIRIGAESFSRQLNFGGNWNRIRVLMRFSATDSGANITTAGFTVGASAGATQGYESGSMVGFVGAQLGNSLGTYDNATYTRSTYGSVLAYRLAGITAVYKTGSSVTVGSGNSANSGYCPIISSGFIGGVYADIVRSPTYFTVYGGGWDSSVTSNLSIDQFNLACDNSTTTVWNTFASSTVAYTGNDVFDSVMIRWNKANPTLEFSDLRVIRYY